MGVAVGVPVHHRQCCGSGPIFTGSGSADPVLKSVWILIRYIWKHLKNVKSINVKSINVKPKNVKPINVKSINVKA